MREKKGRRSTNGAIGEGQDRQGVARIVGQSLNRRDQRHVARQVEILVPARLSAVRQTMLATLMNRKQAFFPHDSLDPIVACRTASRIALQASNCLTINDLPFVATTIQVIT